MTSIIKSAFQERKTRFMELNRVPIANNRQCWDWNHVFMAIKLVFLTTSTKILFMSSREDFLIKWLSPHLYLHATCILSFSQIHSLILRFIFPFLLSPTKCPNSTQQEVIRKEKLAREESVIKGKSYSRQYPWAAPPGPFF